MSDELLSLARRIVDRARGGEGLEAFVTHEKSFSVKVYNGEVETLSSSEPRGAGVRILDGGRAGFAYTTDLSDKGLDSIVEIARTNAQHATPDEAVGLAEAWQRRPKDVPDLLDKGQNSVGPESKGEVAIATTRGIEGAYRSTDAWCYSLAIATEGDDTEVGFEFGLARGLAGLDAEAVAQRSAARAVAVLGATKVPSARMPVVFDPYTAGQFLGVLAQALTGEAVQKGRSLFAGRIGQAVAGAGLTLVDDGRVPGAPGSAPWDAEGVPTQRTEVIRRGVLESFLFDVTSARREGRSSTGNAARSGFQSPPGPAPTNLAFDSTGESRDEVLARAGRALLVQDFHGVHSGANPVSGDFSVGATGMLLEDGAPVRPVKEITIAAPMLEILAGIVAIADDRRWLPFGGSLGGATTLIAEMTVAGE